MPRRMYKKGVKKKVGYLTAKQKKETVSLIRRQIQANSEHKQYVQSVANQAVYAGAVGSYMTHLTSIGQGPGDSERVGDEINLHAVQMKMLFYNRAGVTSNPYTVWRISVFQYKSQDNAPAVGEAFLSNAASGGTYGAMSGRNIDYLGVYNFLYDKTFVTVAGEGNAANYGNVSNYVIYKEFYVNLKYVKKKIQFEAGGSGTVNGIYMFVTTGQPSVTTNPLFSFTASIRYTDS